MINEAREHPVARSIALVPRDECAQNGNSNFVFLQCGMRRSKLGRVLGVRANKDAVDATIVWAHNMRKTAENLSAVVRKVTSELG
jgi:hypothetical protein